jgi:hypothetical protein
VFAAWASTQHGAQIKCLRSDCGSKYTGAKFTKFLNEQGTEQRLTTHDTPQHNRVAESLNRHLVEHVRALLHQSKLPKNLWGKAIHFCIWLKNRTLTQVIGKATTLFKWLTRHKPNLTDVPKWGQCIWVHRDLGSKLDTRASTMRWVGFNQDSPHAHPIYWPEKGLILVECDVKSTFKWAVVYTLRFPTLQADLQASVPHRATTPQPSTAALLAAVTPPQTPVPSTPVWSHGLQATWIPHPSTTTIDSSNEDDDQVESELSDLTDLSTDGPSTPVPRKHKSKPTEAVQPMHQSTWTHKPSAHVC